MSAMSNKLKPLFQFHFCVYGCCGWTWKTFRLLCMWESSLEKTRNELSFNESHDKCLEFAIPEVERACRISATFPLYIKKVKNVTCREVNGTRRKLVFSTCRFFVPAPRSVALSHRHTFPVFRVSKHETSRTKRKQCRKWGHDNRISSSFVLDESEHLKIL